MIIAKVINAIVIQPFSGAGYVAGKTGVKNKDGINYSFSKVQINDVSTGFNVANIQSDNAGYYEVIGLDPHRCFVVISIDIDKDGVDYAPVAATFYPRHF